MSIEVEFEYTGKERVPEDVTIVRFHSSVIEVVDYIFYNCKQLKKVTLNEGLQTIGKHAFFQCKSLESITLPSTVTKICYVAFAGCFSLREVVLNEGLQTIDPSAFVSCTSLESITIPSTVTEISGRTFHNCRKLREVGLHEGIKKIRGTAFYKCPLERFTFPKLSTRLETITLAGQTEVEDKIDNIRGYLNVERRGSELFSSAANRSWNDEWKFVRAVLGRIERLLTYYELREATTLLELAMWKSKMDQANTNRIIINRDVYRIDIPGPVKDTILQFLNFRV